LGISTGGTNRANISSSGLNLAVPLQMLGTDVLDMNRNLVNIGNIGMGGSLSIGDSVVIDSSRNILNVGSISMNGNLNVGGTAVIDPLRNIINVNWVNASDFNASNSVRASRFLIGNTEVITSGRLIQAADGSASSPGYSFNSDTDTGIYRGGENTLNFVTGGSNRLTISTTAFTTSLPWQGIDGSVNSPAYSFSSETNTGIYRAGTGILGISTGGTNRANISSSGLNLAVPLQMLGTDVLDMNRNLVNIGWVNATNLNLTNNFYIGGNIYFTPDVRLFRGAANRLDLDSGNSLNLVSGNLQIEGISVITSSRLVQAADGSVNSPAYSFNSDTNTGIYRASEDNLRFVTGGSDRLTIDSSGRIGIGTVTPTEKLEVQGRVLIASSNPFELEPSDNILDVKGSINATVAFYVPKHSTQPFACDSSKESAIFFNTTDKKFYGCTGTVWVIIGTEA
ncbi:MAG: hypothetical protein QXG39_08125, partial [Candidatus Aenigmatarchaeota archaeon]